MLLQYHHQFKDGRTEIIAQAGINNGEQEISFVRDMVKRYPPPEGEKWLVCNEKSKHFWMTPAQPEGD